MSSTATCDYSELIELLSSRTHLNNLIPGLSDGPFFFVHALTKSFPKSVQRYSSYSVSSLPRHLSSQGIRYQGCSDLMFLNIPIGLRNYLYKPKRIPLANSYASSLRLVNLSPKTVCFKVRAANNIQPSNADEKYFILKNNKRNSLT